jgi:hypothetical protein
MIGLVALDLVLRIVAARVGNVALLVHVAGMHAHHPAANTTGFRIPADMISDLEALCHEAAPPLQLPINRDARLRLQAGRPVESTPVFLTNITMEAYFQSGNQPACHQEEGVLKTVNRPPDDASRCRALHGLPLLRRHRDQVRKWQQDHRRPALGGFLVAAVAEGTIRAMANEDGCAGRSPDAMCGWALSSLVAAGSEMTRPLLLMMN